MIMYIQAWHMILYKDCEVNTIIYIQIIVQVTT